jgi:hypothetical protein
MKFNILDSISKRKSTRSFSRQIVSPETQTLIKEYVILQKMGPFGSKISFHFIDSSNIISSQTKLIESFGLIHPSGYYILGAVIFSDYTLLDYGYLLEKIVLYMTYLGLSSCWLGAFFNKPAFRNLINIQEYETIPAILMVGHPSDRSSLLDKSMRMFIKSDNRKSFHQLFFDGDFQTTLSFSGKHKYLLALEMLRKAPSSINRQPWRVVKETKLKKFHFYLQHSIRETIPNNIDLQKIDMGIAMVHFSETMAQLDFPGMWSINDPEIPLPNNKIEYIATWAL